VNLDYKNSEARIKTQLRAASDVTTPPASALSFTEKVPTATPISVLADKAAGCARLAQNAGGANFTETGTFLYQQSAPNCGSTSGCS
jgi:hypothetical protein